MKKLLSLLSVLTISGSAVPTTIAASPYQKEESLNSNINLQTNNLKILKRNKRQNNNFPPNDFKGINISNNVNNYFIQLCEFITYLRENNIVRTIRGQVSSENNPISCGLDGHTPREDYFINTNTPYNYFKIPIILEENEQSRMIYLIFRSSDFYLQGFINNRNYYYFNNSTISVITDAISNNNLGFEGDYNNLMRVASSGGGSQNPQITWEGIQDAFFQLSNMGTSHQQRPPIIAASLIRVILATAESLRFRQGQNLIINSVNNSGIPGTSVYWNNFIEIIKNWKKWTKEAINYLLLNGNLFNFPRITDILIFHSIISKEFNNCDRRNARDLNNNEEYCFVPPNTLYNDIYYVSENGLVLKETDVPYPTTTMYTFRKDSTGQRKNGDIYFGTTNGVYLRKNGESTTTKIDGINEFISLIESYINDGQVHIINNKGEVYYIDENGLVLKETDVPYPITTMYTFRKDSTGQRKNGDIYFGTTNGVYLRKNGESTTTKIDGINEPVKLIESYINDGQVHIINNKGEVYYIDENGLVLKETDVPYPITTMYTFRKDSTGQRKNGDIYFGTTNGVYLRKNGESTTTKIDGINEFISLIESYINDGQVHIINNKIALSL